MGTSLIDNFDYRGRRFLDDRQQAATLAALRAIPESTVPDGFRAYCAETGRWYEYGSANTADPATGRWKIVPTLTREITDDENTSPSNKAVWNEMERIRSVDPTQFENIGFFVIGATVAGNIVASDFNIGVTAQPESFHCQKFEMSAGDVLTIADCGSTYAESTSRLYVVKDRATNEILEVAALGEDRRDNPKVISPAKGQGLTVYVTAQTSTFKYIHYVLNSLNSINNTNSQFVKLDADIKNQGVLRPAGGNLIFQYTEEDLSGRINDAIIELPFLVIRDKSQTKLTLSKRKLGYNLHVTFLDSAFRPIKNTIVGLSKTIDIPDACVYFRYRDYAGELRPGNIGSSMLNYGDTVMDYEPFIQCSGRDMYLHLKSEVKDIEKHIADNAGNQDLDLTSIATERIFLKQGNESLLYLDDLIAGKGFIRQAYRKCLLNTQLTSAADMAFVRDPAVNEETGTLRLSSNHKVLNIPLKVKVVPVPDIGTINMLDIGSSYIDQGHITRHQRLNYEADGKTVNLIGNMGTDGCRHEARSGGTWDFVTRPLGRAVVLTVSGGMKSIPVTGYPGTTYQDANGVKWTVRGLHIDNNVEKIILSSFSVDPNYGAFSASQNSADYDAAAENIPDNGVLTKTSNDSLGTTTPQGDEAISYSGKELIYYNPFWNPQTDSLDFRYYIEKWNFPIPDIVSFTFGSNDLGNDALASDTLIQSIMDKAVAAVDRLHSDYPDCKVLITSSCYGYAGKSEKETITPIREHNLQGYYKALVRTFGESSKYSPFVAVVPTLFMMDRINGFNVKEVTPCDLYGQAKVMVASVSNAVHPNENGYRQYANAMLGYAYKLLGQ